HTGSYKFPREFQKTLEAIETNIRAAYSVLLAIRPYDRRFFFLLPEPLRLPIDWSKCDTFDQYLGRMVQHCARLTGRDPHVVASKKGRGRQKHARTKATYPLMVLIWKIARAVKRHHGNLTLDRHKRRGTWVEALEGLRPLFPEGFIPHAVPFSMIE